MAASAQTPSQQPPPGPSTVAVGAGTVAVTQAPAVTAGVAAAGILAALIRWLSALRAQHSRWLTDNLGRYSTNATSDDIAQVVAGEMVLEQEFARNSADRVASALPTILAISDAGEREAQLRALLAQEQVYARQRAEAMAARAIAALTRAVLRRESPLGAFWRLGVAKDHTEGCKFMAGRFWPWAVLDRVHPPRHYGCTSSLHGFGEAIQAGWMTAGDVPDVNSAVQLARGVVMEAEVADALLAELELREQLEARGIDTSAIPLRGVRKEVVDGATPVV